MHQATLYGRHLGHNVLLVNAEPRPQGAKVISEVSRNWAGEPLDSYQKILNYARTIQTQTGLKVTAYLDRRHYPCGRKPTPDQIASLRLQRHETLPEWNYTITSHNCKLVLA